MRGKSIAKLIFVCFLASCYSCKSEPKSEPKSESAKSESGKSESGKSESGKSEPDTKSEPGKSEPDTKGGPGGLQTSQRGNCLFKRGTINGTPIEKCEYSINNVLALCPTNTNDCKSNPPSGKCSTTPPVAVAPSPCP